MKKNFIVFVFFAFVLNLFLFSQNNSQFISQSVPTRVLPGQQFTATFVFKNTGTTTWTDADNYHLGSQSPQDNLNWGLNRIQLPNDVAPNDEVTITATFTAPSTTGTYDFQWRMVQDGVEWFGDFSDLVTITVDTINDAQFISQSVPASVLPGQQFTATLVFRNTGTTTWTDGENYRVGTQNPTDNTYWGNNRIQLPNDVAPNDEVTIIATLTAPTEEGFYNFQWQMVQDGVEWFGEKSQTITVLVANPPVDTMFTPGNHFSVSSHIVSTTFFPWYAENYGQMHGPWVPLDGRDSWDGSVEFWKKMIKEVMRANIDVLYVELIPVMEDKRGNLFLALNKLRQEGWNVPKVCPFFDPVITYDLLGYNIDCSTTAGKDELVSHYIRFYEQYFLANPDPYADDFIYTQDNRPVLNIWHIHLNINNYDQLTRDDVTSRLSAALGATHPIFNNDIVMINNAISPAFNFADERVYQFEEQEYKIDKLWNGINTSLLKPGYWDQNVRDPGYFLARDGGVHYADSWNAVISDNTINRVQIESFNEYDEGSGIYAARTDTIYKRVDSLFQNTEDDVWSNNNDPFEYIKTTANGAAQFNDCPERDAKILWHNLPDTMFVNQHYNATIIVRNEGDMLWLGADSFKLGEMEMLDSVWFGQTRYLINDTTNEIPRYGGIFRGRPIAFNIELVAPNTPGVYTTHWSMVQELVAWFGDTLTKQIVTNAIENTIKENVKIYPNPVNDYLFIETNSKENVSISVIDLTGKSVKSYNLSGSEKIKINTSNLQEGVYFIRIKSNNVNVVKKIVKMK